MKNLPLFLTSILLTLSLGAFSQKSITWQGGFPGKENDWHCPQNWSTSCVPDEFSNVFIPDVSTKSGSAPILQSGKVEINYLFLDTDAQLTINPKAQLIVYGKAEGIHSGNVEIQGSFMILNEPVIEVNETIYSRR